MSVNKKFDLDIGDNRLDIEVTSNDGVNNNSNADSNIPNTGGYNKANMIVSYLLIALGCIFSKRQNNKK